MSLPHCPGSRATLDLFPGCLLDCHFRKPGGRKLLTSPLVQPQASWFCVLGFQFGHPTSNSSDQDSECEACFLESSNRLVLDGFSTTTLCPFQLGCMTPRRWHPYPLVGYIMMYFPLKQATSRENTGAHLVIIRPELNCGTAMNWGPHRQVPGTWVQRCRNAPGRHRWTRWSWKLACFQQELWVLDHAGSYTHIYICIYMYIYICKYT